LKLIAPLLVIIFFLIKFINKQKKVNRIFKNDMESCISCGTFVSKDLAIIKGGEIYCSEKCFK
tara:strand:+ start:253 stop:441 length:189 start_codon:yes stop_codon:yes gene_type:complete